MRSGRAPSLLALLLVSCATDTAPPRSQALVFVDTDLASPSVVDRVRIEIRSGDEGELAVACGGCSQEIVIESETDWPISFGVQEPMDGERRWAHAVLFPAGRIANGNVIQETAIEALVELTFGDGVAAQEIFLGGACAGIPADLAGGDACRDGGLEPVAQASPRNPDAPSRVGTYQEAAHRTCSGEARGDTGVYDDDACIDGGTYWMGDVRRQGFGGHVDGVPEHLVTVSPFFLDRYEYTVGRYQNAVMRGFVPSSGPPGPGPGCHDLAPTDGSLTAYPVNCVTPSLAEELCAFDGRRLPTEAEREWAAGNGAEELLFPWSDELIRTARGVDRPGAVGSRDFDVTVIGEIHDLGWNVTEWVADDFQMYTEPCWAPGEYGIDPLCKTTAGDVQRGRAARGGYWVQSGDAGSTYYPMAPTRRTFPEGQAYFIGFRCARGDDAGP